MKYEGNIPDDYSNSFWTNVKTRWNYNDNSTWIKLIGVTDREWNGTFQEIDGFALFVCLFLLNLFLVNWGNEICLKWASLNNQMLFKPYPTFFTGLSKFIGQFSSKSTTT